MLLNHDEVRRRAQEVKLISVDLDGTLLNEARDLTPRSAAAINALLEKGYLVVPTTGRTLDQFIDRYPDLGAAKYAITANGALVTELSSGKNLLCNSIPVETAARLITDLLDHPQSLVYLNALTTCKTAYWRMEDILEFGNGRKPFGVEPVTAAALCDWLRQTDDSILEIGLNFRREDGFAHYEQLTASRYLEIDCFRVAQHNLEFVRHGVSKAAALEALCSILGLTPSQVCAIGDNGNDVETIRFAGLGVAMGNAIRPAREAADYVTLSNEEDGAADFIERFFL